MSEKAYELLPVGVAFCTGRSEEDAIEKFVAERDDVERKQIVGVVPQSRKLGMYMIHYSRPGVTQLDLFPYVQLRDICIECGEYIDLKARAPHQRYCSDKCRQRACRRRKREKDIGRALEEGSA